MIRAKWIIIIEEVSKLHRMRLIAGLDEAGRGPAIGPMVIAGVSLREEDMKGLLKIGVKDSKKLTAKKREELLPKIMGIIENYHVEVLDAAFIDSERSRENLNQIEAGVMASIVERLWPDVAQIGSVDVDSARFGAEISRRMIAKPEVVSVHHAEDKFPAVAAASIVAKTTRDRIISDLRLSWGDFGSGYPSDPKTRRFISEAVKSGKLPPIVRRTWKTVAKTVADNVVKDNLKIKEKERPGTQSRLP